MNETRENFPDPNVDKRAEAAQQPEAGATEEGIALHGNKAREERYEQPDAVELPGGTLIATGDDEK